VYIFSKIKEVSIDKYDLNFLNFVKNYSVNCIGGYSSEDEIVQLYGIPLLWKYMQDDKSIKVQAKNVISLETSVQFLHELLMETNIPLKITESYIKFSLDNIKINQSVVQSLNLIIKCFESISKNSEGEKNINFLISLDKNENLIQIIVADLVRYMKEHCNSRKSLVSDSNSDSLMNNVDIC
jgi:hypothetical protein